nr:hypothetical protein [Tanacetum cinerariifolium]
MACNPKDYYGKGGAIVYTRWIEKIKLVLDMSGCRVNQKVKYTADSFINKTLTWWNSQVHTRGREAVIGITWDDFKTLTREEFCPNNDIQKLETEFWCHTMIRVMVAATKPKTIQSVVLKAGMLTDKGWKYRDDNKRSRTGMTFATITNLVRKEYTGTAPKCTKCNYHYQLEVPCCSCTNYNRFGHIAKDCRMGPRVVNPLNARNLTAAHEACFECGGTNHYNAACPRLNRAPRLGGNRRNQVMAIEGGQCRRNNGNQARRRDFVIGAKEARHDPSIVTGTFTLNNQYAMTLFDFDADYSFVSTTFIPMLDIESSNLGMDWLSRLKAEIVYHEKDKSTTGDKRLDLSAFKLSCLFFSLLSSESLVVGDHMGFSEPIVTTH